MALGGLLFVVLGEGLHVMAAAALDVSPLEALGALGHELALALFVGGTADLAFQVALLEAVVAAELDALLLFQLVALLALVGLFSLLAAATVGSFLGFALLMCGSLAGLVLLQPGCAASFTLFVCGNPAGPALFAGPTAETAAPVPPQTDARKPAEAAALAFADGNKRTTLAFDAAAPGGTAEAALTFEALPAADNGFPGFP